MYISFAWTVDAFLADRKSVTRRLWKDHFAAQFKPSTIHHAYDKNPRNGGKRIGEFVILSTKKEDISTMPESDYEREGFQYMEERGIHIWGKPARQAFDDWKATGGLFWVVRFRKLG